MNSVSMGQNIYRKTNNQVITSIMSVMNVEERMPSFYVALLEILEKKPREPIFFSPFQETLEVFKEF